MTRVYAAGMHEHTDHAARPSVPSSRALCRRCGREVVAAAPGEHLPHLECACGARLHRTGYAEPIELATIALDDVPEGAWRRGDFGGVRIGASKASASALLMTLVFAVFWLGIIGFFSFAAWASVYMHVTGVQTLLPGWQISKDLPLDVWLTVFAVLFLVPFQLVGLSLLWSLLMSLGGRLEMFIAGDDSWVEERFGIASRRTQFRQRDVRDVHLVRTQDSRGRRRAGSTIELWFEGPNEPSGRSAKRFALPRHRQRWLAAAWRDALLAASDAR